ncbi:MAG: OmpA family protein [Chitinophagales bacterium]|nr:OmpA family protein [Chitinophagales bacterium]
MKFSQILMIFLCFFLVSQTTYAQKKSKTFKADTYYEQADYQSALKLYKKCYAKAKKPELKAEVAYKAAQCYSKIRNSVEAEIWYKKAIDEKYDDPIVHLKYGDALKSNGKYAEAIAAYNTYGEESNGDPRAKAGVASAEVAQGWKDKPTRHRVDNVNALNTSYYEFSTSFANKERNKLYFTSSREESTGSKNDGWTGQKEFDIFEASIDNNGKWSLAQPIDDEVVNSKESEGSIYFDPNTNRLFFTRCYTVKDRPDNCKIFVTKLQGKTWSEPTALPFHSDDYNIGHPALSQDGKLFLFASDMPGGYGGKDLYKVSYDSGADSWGSPENMGATFNSEGDEMFPTFALNGDLYYSSDGKGGMGGLDIFKAKKQGATFGDPENIRSPINSPSDDFAMTFDTDSTGYLSSGREGGNGSEDIYAFVIPPTFFIIKGKVYDTDTKDPIPGAIVELFGSDGTSLSYTTGDAGTYTYKLKPNTKYKVSASYTGYLTKFLEVSTIGLDESKTFIGNFDFPLKSTEKPIELPEIFYDFDRATLRAISKKELDGLIKTLDENPTITIEIMSHTDERGTNEYNVDLSDRRAKSVVDYLIKNGVAKDRLSSKGYGETQPRVSKADILKMKTEKEREAAHQENRRTEFQVLRTDYVPKK